MLIQISPPGAVKPEEFLAFAPPEQKAEILKLASELREKKIVHVNATARGGGVAELLQSLIPELDSLGLDASWYALDSSRIESSFFAVTDKLRDALQGTEVNITAEEWELYQSVNEQVARKLREIPSDSLIVHDWQIAFAGAALSEREAKAYVSHPDTSHPFLPAWERMVPAMEAHKKIAFSSGEFTGTGLSRDKLVIIPPAIDPLALKQRLVPAKTARSYLASYGIPEAGPLVVQVSRFDIWKNPSGVVEAFKLIKSTYPEAKLALVGFQEASDNPEALRVYGRIRAMTEGDPDAFLFFDPAVLEDGDSIEKFTMMAQNAADVVVQNSVREGFGLTITEAMWKGKAVVGGPASGVRRQIVHKETGLIAKSVQELAASIEYMISDRQARERLGRAARESVRNSFLMPRLLLDHLRLYREL